MAAIKILRGNQERVKFFCALLFSIPLKETRDEILHVLPRHILQLHREERKRKNNKT